MRDISQTYAFALILQVVAGALAVGYAWVAHRATPKADRPRRWSPRDRDAYLAAQAQGRTALRPGYAAACYLDHLEQEARRAADEGREDGPTVDQIAAARIAARAAYWRDVSEGARGERCRAPHGPWAGPA